MNLEGLEGLKQARNALSKAVAKTLSKDPLWSVSKNKFAQNKQSSQKEKIGKSKPLRKGKK